ncbi:hypothetical protein SAPIO_CDS8223 [Scedosporium apiospermum]|uniref:Zn(2)-C6 fungal-type domain-containing protein n=1 Tax=Pseudallescheria apiosperma TaxID=563466 RepID=A0A084FZ57_PSEDA|nr:uncharacterized protein SAPIO_CDS8223 [Scedosporium apiospermum]KEZ40369.1 hypothetical protein SAPIO_CDS8223 [Scedosporium apiospermum]
MSMTAVERANPPPRRKSCAACTKAKRRCDLAQPSCLRCAGRGIECHYPHGIRPNNSNRLTSLSSTPSTPSTPSSIHAASVILEAPVPTTPVLNKTTETFAFDALLDEFLTREPVSMNGVDCMSYGCDLVQEPSPQSGSIDLPGLDNNNDLLMAGDTGQLVPLDIGLPARWADPGCFEPLPHVIADRLEYSLELLRRTPKMLVEELRAPWCHSSLYEDNMPKSVQGIYLHPLIYFRTPSFLCFMVYYSRYCAERSLFPYAIACCAMYNARNSLNKPFIMRIIMSRTKELAESPIPSSPLEALARCQALLVYHLMGLLDGDIQFRASTESTIPLLREASTALLPVISAHESRSSSLTNLTKSTQELPLFPITETEAFWRSWIFTESARRTCLFTLHFLVAYQILSCKGPPSCEDTLLCEEWTLSTYLWTARNAVDFAVAWRDRRHLVVKCSSFEDMFREAEPDDLDEFGRMLMVSFMGAEQTRGWFASKGGKL